MHGIKKTDLGGFYDPERETASKPNKLDTVSTGYLL